MRILCVTGHSDRPETETIIGLKRSGVEIRVLCPASAPHRRRMIDAGVSVAELQLESRIDLKSIKAIRRHIEENHIDILHLFNNRALSNGILAARGLPLKVIAYRGIVANVHFLNPASWLTYLHPRIDRIICVAEAVRVYFLNMKMLWFRFPRDKAITIYKGHDLAWYQSTPLDLSTFGIPRGSFVVACTANDRPRKGLPTLIEAMRHLPPGLPIHLLLIGNMKAPALGKLIARSPAADRIHLAGYRQDAPALQAACQVVVLPALRREGLPKVIIEAMAYGVPPIVTDSGGSPELIEDGISGIVIPSGNSQAIAQAIIQLYHDPDGRRTMGQNARLRIDKCFRVEDTIRKTLAVYRELLGGEGAGASS